MNEIPGWLAIILAPGGGMFVWAVFKGLDLWRNGTQAQEGRAIRNLERFAEREAFRADRALDLLDYWRSHAAACEYIIRTEIGPDKVPSKPPLPPDPPRRITDVEVVNNPPNHRKRKTDSRPESRAK